MIFDFIMPFSVFVKYGYDLFSKSESKVLRENNSNRKLICHVS